MFVSLTLGIWTANGAEHGVFLTKTTLWSDCPLEIASQGETIEGLQRLLSSSFRRPDTEVGNFTLLVHRAPVND